MYLKRLDIQGFKSFPEKVKLEFHQGITAVVGPNGSGKSNISDAVRWVLGEQKVKSLRGDKMEDIIFAGTQNRKPLGFAEVSITLDNQDGKIQIDYTEVTVTRRVFRSGESEYLMNGTSCRLKDIHELFMDTGIGKEGYSIIGQGKIDEILSSKSDDRRKLFEEAAGIVKFKNRRNEAIAKLEQEQQNLMRIDDIVSELETQINPLLKQSEKAKEYLLMKQKLKDLETNVFCIEGEKLEKEIADVEKNYNVSFENEAIETKFSCDIKEQIQSLKNKTEKLTGKIQQENEMLIQIRTELERAEGDTNLTKEQIQNCSKEMERLSKEIEGKQKKIQENKSQISIYQTKFTAIQFREKTEENNLKQLEKDFDNLNQNLDESENFVEKNKSELIEKIKESTELKGNISQKNSMLLQLNQRKNQIDDEKSYLGSRIQIQENHILALKKQTEQNIINKKQMQQQLEQFLFESNQLQEERKHLKKQLQEKEKELNENNSRFSVLCEMEKEHEGFFKSVKSVLDLKADGICGAVGELLTVSKQYEIAIEMALGASLQSIVTETEEHAKIAVEYLKKNYLGRATFLPLTAVKGKKLKKGEFEKEKGFLGIAADLIKYPKKFENIIHSVLGKVIIIDKLDFALAFAKKYQYAYKIVTLDGEILNAGGAITGGSIAKKTTNIFSRSREIKQLKQWLEQAATDFLEKKQFIEQKKLEIENYNQSCIERNLQIQKLQLTIDAAEKEKERTYEQIVLQKDKYNLYEIEEKQLQEQLLYIEQDKKICQDCFLKVEKQMERLNLIVSQYQENVESEKNSKEIVLEQITKLRISLSNYEQDKKAINATINRNNKENQLLKQEIGQFELKIQENFDLKKQREEKIALIQSNLEEKKLQQQQKQDFLISLTETRKQTSNHIYELEEQLQQNLEIISQLKNDCFRMETKKEKLEEEKQKLYQQMWEEYEITYQMAKQLYEETISYTELKKEVKKIRLEIKELGSVNVNAIEDYKEIKQRYEFLNTQKQDILEAEKKLKGIIIELSDLMENQFKEQFSIISENFNIVFQEMFGGGKAYLKLSDENNILESPVEIIAQPTGKNLQNMMLLSGGERALTAIAILFSILKMKPSPFCILDEIEAALDDANVKRYADYLEKFSKDTQFIVITHRKGTMEAANIMYGITMQEKGISKLVSVNFLETKYA